MCEKISAIAEIIYTALNEKITQLLTTTKHWQNCTSVAVNNTSAYIDIQNLQKTKTIVFNNSMCFCGCPCHKKICM